MNAAEVLLLVSKLEVAYQYDMHDPERKLWIVELAETDAALAFGAAEARIRSDERFMPRVGEILTAVRDAARPSGMDAWALVVRQIRSVGVYREPRFDDPAIARAVAVIGWHRLCMSDEDSEWPQREFERVYAGVVQAVDRQAALEAGFSAALASPELRELTDGLGDDDA